jgi:chitodextrinase
MDPASFFKGLRQTSVTTSAVDIGVIVGRGRQLVARKIIRASVVTIVLGGFLIAAGLGARGVVEGQGPGGPAADASPPTSPTELRVEPVGPREVDLAWAAATDDVPVAGYTIYRGDRRLGTVDGTTLSFADQSVDAGTEYSYRVDAFDAASNHSDRSDEASTKTPPETDRQQPSIPEGLRAEASTPTEVFLTWSPSIDNVGIAGYTIFRDGSELATVDGITTAFDDATATESSTYTLCGRSVRRSE